MRNLVKSDSRNSVKPPPVTPGQTASELFGKGVIQIRKSEVIGEHLGLNDHRMLASASEPKWMFNKCRLKSEDGQIQTLLTYKRLKYHKHLVACLPDRAETNLSQHTGCLEM